MRQIELNKNAAVLIFLGRIKPSLLQSLLLRSLDERRLKQFIHARSVSLLEKQCIDEEVVQVLGHFVPDALIEIEVEFVASWVIDRSAGYQHVDDSP